MKTIKFAMVQMDIIHGDIDANENHVTTLLDDVEKHGADLVVFPELWNTGYDLEGQRSPHNDRWWQYSRKKRWRFL